MIGSSKTLSIKVASFIFSALLFSQTGCFTVTEEKYRTSEQRYPEGYVIKGLSMDTEEAKKDEIIKINVQTEKRWRIDTQSICYDERIQYREYATFDERGYRLEGDLFETVLYITTLGPFMTAILFPFHLFETDHPRPFLCHYTIGALPGICATVDYPSKDKRHDNGFSEFDVWFNGACPVNKRTSIDKQIRVTNTKIESEYYNLNFTITVYDAKQTKIASKKMSSGGTLNVSLCDTILSHPESPYIIVRIDPGAAKIEGPQEQILKFDLASIIERKVTADANPSSYAPATFALSAPKLDSRRKDGRLEAGMEGVLAVPVANTGTGDGYKVVVDVLETTGAVQVSKSSETLILRAGKDGLVNVPFSIPVQAQDGTSTVSLVATDALGRRSPPLTLEIPYAHRAMPKLMLTGAELIRGQSATDEYYVDVRIRNKGDGYAEKVGLSCDSDAARIHVVQTTGLTDDIAPRDWRTVRMSAKIPDVTVGQVLKIKLSVAERFGVGDAADEFEVVVPE